MSNTLELVVDIKYYSKWFPICMLLISAWLGGVNHGRNTPPSPTNVSGTFSKTCLCVRGLVMLPNTVDGRQRRLRILPVTDPIVFSLAYFQAIGTWEYLFNHESFHVFL